MRRGIKGIIAGFATAAVGAILVLSPLGANFEENLGLAWLFSLRGSIQPPEEMVVLAINDQTGESLGLSKLPREWPRTIHAQLVENLTRKGASAIVFDFDFQLQKKPEDDALFGQAANNSGRVIFVEKLIGKRQPLINASGKQTGSVWVEQLMPPIPVLAESAKGLGSFTLPKVQVAVHQFWVFKSSLDAPTIPAVALQIHAMSAYPYLMRLMENAGVAAPSPPGKDAHANEIREFMSKLHSIFSNNLELAKTLTMMLTKEGQSDIPSEERQRVQALIGLYEGNDYRHLNFYGPPGSITTIPYQLFASNQPSDSGKELPDLTGKVVFVGFSDLYDPGQPDRFYTVFSNDEGVDLSGVEIAATAFGNLLTDRCLRSPGELWDALIVTAFGGVIGIIAYLFPAIAGVPLVLFLATGYGKAAQQLFTQYDVWLPISIPLLVQLPLALFNGLLTQYFLERRKKTRANKAISLYLPENLARDFIKKDLDESALNRVTYCVCFASDMAGFTTISEKLTPKELASFLNEYFEILSAPLRRHGVDVIEFRADGIMCAWTADQPDPGIRRKALLAGLEAIEAIDGFKKRYDQFAHALRIGLEVGMAYVGHAGGGGHFVYSIVGDCANTSARIEGLNKQLKTQLLASNETIEDVDDFLCRFVGEFVFVGKTEPLPIYEIVSVKTNASEAQEQLCNRFAIAMDEMHHGRWIEASNIFKAILIDYPQDGPSQYHLSRCQGFVEVPANESSWIVRMDIK
jgi:adenylate cyclase